MTSAKTRHDMRSIIVWFKVTSGSFSSSVLVVRSRRPFSSSMLKVPSVHPTRPQGLQASLLQTRPGSQGLPNLSLRLCRGGGGGGGGGGSQRDHPHVADGLRRRGTLNFEHFSRTVVLFFLFALLLTTFQNNQGAAVFLYTVNRIFLIFTSCLFIASFPGFRGGSLSVPIPFRYFTFLGAFRYPNNQPPILIDMHICLDQ